MLNTSFSGWISLKHEFFWMDSAQKRVFLDGFRAKTHVSESDQTSPEGKPRDKAIIVIISILPITPLIRVPGGQ